MGFLFGILVGAFFGFMVGGCMLANSVLTIQKQAIEHGYAHQVITDSIRGTTEFQWQKGAQNGK